MRRRAVWSGSRTGPDALGHNLGRGRSVDLSGSNGSEWSYSRVTPGAADRASSQWKIQAIIAQRLEHLWLQRWRRTGVRLPMQGTRPCGASESSGKAGHVTGMNPSGGKRSLTPGPHKGNWVAAALLRGVSARRWCPRSRSGLAGFGWGQGPPSNRSDDVGTSHPAVWVSSVPGATPGPGPWL